MLLHGLVRVEVIQGPVRLGTAGVIAVVHALNLVVPSPRALAVLRRLRDKVVLARRSRAASPLVLPVERGCEPVGGIGQVLRGRERRRRHRAHRERFHAGEDVAW